MLNWFARLMLVATSLSPILGAIAVTSFTAGDSWKVWGLWVGAAVLLAFICWGLLWKAASRGQKEDFRIEEFESKDSEVLAFLLTYLLPFLSTDKLTFGDQWLVSTYILAVIFLTIKHADAFHFNPVMGFFGYHFYAVKDAESVSHLLITKEAVRRPKQIIKTVKITHNIHLQIEAK